VVPPVLVVVVVVLVLVLVLVLVVLVDEVLALPSVHEQYVEPA
jgi:hypothetical protein